MWWLVLPGSAPLATKPTGLALQAATRDGEAARLGTVVFASTYKVKDRSEGSLRIFLVSVFI